MTSGHVCSCGQPAPDATICRSCRDRLARDLGELPAYARELDITLTRQRGTPLEGGSSSAERPLPFHPAASEASWVLRDTLIAWVRALDPDPARWPDGTLAGMAFWLLARVHILSQHEAAADAVDEISSAVSEVKRVIDRPPDRVYAGECGAPLEDPADTTTGSVCHEDLYARPGHQVVTCRACGASYGVDDRRVYLLAAVEDVLATATEIARSVSRLGQPVAAERIRQWRARERIEVRGLSMRGDPLYRVGDVLDLVAKTDGRVAS